MNSITADLGRDVMELRAALTRSGGELVGYALTAIVAMPDGKLEYTRYASSPNRLALHGAEIESILLSAVHARPKIPVDDGNDGRAG